MRSRLFAFATSSLFLFPIIACRGIVGIDDVRFVDGGAPTTTDAATNDATNDVASNDDVDATTPPSTLHVTGDCVTGQGALTTHNEPITSSPKLVFVAHYSSLDCGSGNPKATITVRVKRATSIVLVLSSGTATAWTLQTSGDVRIVRVFLNSSSSATSTITGTDAPVEMRSITGTDHEWPQAQPVVQQFEEMAGAKLAAYGGCYESASFEVSD